MVGSDRPIPAQKPTIRRLKGGPSPREFVATLLSLPLLVTALLGFGITNLARVEIHKRLMMLASVVVLTPAVARIIQLIAPSMSRLTRNFGFGRLLPWCQRSR